MKSVSLILALAASAAVAAPTPNSRWWSWHDSNGDEGDNAPNDVWWDGPGGDNNNGENATPTSSSPPTYGTGSSTVSPLISSPSPSSSSSGSSSTPSSGGSLPGPVVNDYPTKYQDNCDTPDQWGLTSCQCVSFAAWRIASRIDADFSRGFDAETWSNANTWGSAASAAGLTVDNNPTPGAIAQTDAGAYGHVAWVAAVNGDSVQIEEYNALNPLGYDTRTVSASEFQYIHIAPTSS